MGGQVAMSLIRFGSPHQEVNLERSSGQVSSHSGIRDVLELREAGSEVCKASHEKRIARGLHSPEGYVILLS